MKFSDAVGGYTADASQAAEYIRTWFRPEDLINIAGIPEGATSGGVQSQSEPAGEFYTELTSQEGIIESLIMDESSNYWNVYVSVCPLIRPVKGKKRATKNNIARIPGVWADIDVKDGSFESQDEIFQWLRSLDCYPTIIVGSGSGGVHAYWKYANERSAREVYDPVAWWSYLNYKAGDRNIDKVADTTRILRIPGTAYFPKDTSVAKIGNVSLIENTRYEYMAEDLRSFANPYHQELEKKWQHQREKEDRTVVDVIRNHYDLNKLTGKTNIGARWFAIANLQLLEDRVNKEYEWDDILGMAGWIKTATQGDGSNQWQRPGNDASPRSAVVDWPGSEGNIMSLVSASEETGLLDLHETGVPLTKFRVMLRLIYGDDTPRMIEDVLRGRTP